LRRFLRKGGKAENFRTAAINRDVMELLTAKIDEIGQGPAIDWAREYVAAGGYDKTISVTAPLATGLAPYDLADAESQPASEPVCPICGKPLGPEHWDHEAPKV